MREKRTTIKDVASLADVSAATVSIVLNGKGDSVPDSTKERIRRAAAKLNYMPDFNARAMVTRRTNIIGIIAPDISNSFFAELVRCIQLELNQYHYDIILCNSDEKTENDLRYIRLLAGRNVDGLILTMSAESLTDENEPLMRKTLADTHVPYLFLDRYYKGDKPKVVVDNAGSSYQIAKYLLDCGHTRIGVITGPMNLNSSYNRMRGLKKAMEEKGLTLDPECVYEGRYDFESGVKGADLLVGKGVTAIFAFSDMQAYGIYESVRRQGKRVPEDVSVIGFDDSFYSSLLETPLTTVRQPLREMAREACRMILDLVNGGSTDCEARLTAEVIVRSSVKKL